MLIERNGGIHVLKVEKKKISMLILYDFFILFPNGTDIKVKKAFWERRWTEFTVEILVKKKKYVVKNIIFMDLLICDKLII